MMAIAASTNQALATTNGDTCKDSEWTVEKVLADLPKNATPTAPSPISFLHLLERLKTTPRAGWTRHKVARPESIADHMYRMAIMTMLAPPSLTARLDRDKCTRMALVHDMAESLVGDITPIDPVSKEEKHRREAHTMEYLCELLGDDEMYAHAAGEIKALFDEYEEGSSLEARFVKDIDKMELLLQRVEYERTALLNGVDCNFDEFSRVAEQISSPEVRTWLEAVRVEREHMWAAVGRSVQ